MAEEQFVAILVIVVVQYSLDHNVYLCHIIICQRRQSCILQGYQGKTVEILRLEEHLREAMVIEG